MPAHSFQTLYDVSRDSGLPGLPALITLAWLIPSIVGRMLIKRTSTGKNPRVFVCCWLSLSAVLMGIGYGVVSREHFARVHELESRQFQVVEGPVMSYRPARPKRSEQFTVGGITFSCFSVHHSQAAWPGDARSPLQVGTYLRVTYDRDLNILRLETPDPRS